MLKRSWDTKVSTIKPKIYLLDNNVWWLVDNRFEKIYKQRHKKFSIDLTLFNFPVFIVYKSDSEGKKNGRAIIDIRKLNDLVFFNYYPLLLKSEIIANVQGYINLAVFDAASFFYQWCLYSDHSFIFTIVTHCGQKTF